MKYAVIKVVNGNYAIVTEGHETVESAKVSYHDTCKILWNAQDVVTAMVAIVDENLDIVEAKKEFIHHEA